MNTQNSDITVDGGVYSVSGTSNAYFMEDGWSNSGSNHVTIQNVTYNGERGVQFSNSDKMCIRDRTGYGHIYGLPALAAVP